MSTREDTDKQYCRADILTHRPHQATACWTSGRSALFLQSDAHAQCQIHARRWRTPAASRMTGGRKAPWCLPQNAWANRQTDRQTRALQWMVRLEGIRVLYAESHRYSWATVMEQNNKNTKAGLINKRFHLQFHFICFENILKWFLDLYSALDGCLFGCLFLGNPQQRQDMGVISGRMCMSREWATGIPECNWRGHLCIPVLANLFWGQY